MRELDVGALPICCDDGRLHGIVTDRDIVVKVLATMEEHRIRRLPVENHRLVGIIPDADLGRHLPEDQIGRFVETVLAAG